MQRRIIPDIVTGGQRLSTLPRMASVSDAALMMHGRQLGAVMIVEEGRLLGIFTERDLARCIATNMDLDSTPLGLVMTWRPRTIRPNQTPMEALERMQDGRFRHLPVVEGTTVMGMVSVRDLFGAVRRELEDGLGGCKATSRQESLEASQAA